MDVFFLGVAAPWDFVEIHGGVGRGRAHEGSLKLPLDVFDWFAFSGGCFCYAERGHAYFRVDHLLLFFLRLQV